MALQGQVQIPAGLGASVHYSAHGQAAFLCISFMLHLHSLLLYYYLIFLIYVLPGTPANV